MAKLAECNTEDCHRGIEVGVLTDDDGNHHNQTRVVCKTCELEGPWHVDDSLARAIGDWNANHVSKGTEAHMQRKAASASDATTSRASQIAGLEQALAAYGPEIAYAKIKEDALRAAGNNSSADYFKNHGAALALDCKRVQAELDALKAQG